MIQTTINIVSTINIVFTTKYLFLLYNQNQTRGFDFTMSK